MSGEGTTPGERRPDEEAIARAVQNQFRRRTFFHDAEELVDSVLLPGERVTCVSRAERPWVPSLSSRAVGLLAFAALASLGGGLLLVLGAFPASAFLTPAEELFVRGAAAGLVGLPLAIDCGWLVGRALDLASRRYVVTNRRLLLVEGRVLGLSLRVGAAVKRAGLELESHVRERWPVKAWELRVRSGGLAVTLERPERVAELVEALRAPVE